MYRQGMAGARASPRGRPRKRTAPEPRRQPEGPLATAAVEAIVVAAERVLDRHGIEGLTTNRIAETAGVSIGTLYRYFPHRDAVVATLYERYIARYAAILPAVLAAHGGAPLPVLLERIVDGYVEVFEAQPRIHARLFQLRTASASHERVAAHLDRIVTTVAGFLAHLRPKAEAPHTIAFVLVHAIDGAANAVAEHAEQVSPRAAGRVLARLVGAYLTDLER